MNKNDKMNIEESNDKGRKLTPVNETFNLNDGTYTGVISDAFFYTDEKVMIKIQISSETIFLIATDVEKIEKYPYSQLLSQANIQYIEKLVGLNVGFEIKNNTSDKGITFSNVKRIWLAE